MTDKTQNQRFQTETFQSEGLEFDDGYQKTVADIEEQTQRSGWLFGRGAFDKADIQYLRDFNNTLRHKETEIEDKEKSLWERERARVEVEASVAADLAAAASLKRRSSGSGGGLGGAGGAGGHGGGKGILAGHTGSRPAPLLLPVKVKPAGSKQQTPQHRVVSPSAGGDLDSNGNKRIRTLGGSFTVITGAVAAAAAPAAARGSSFSSASGLPAAGSEPLAAAAAVAAPFGRPARSAVTAAAAAAGGVSAAQLGRAGSAPTGAGIGSGAENPASASSDGGGLGNLLGGYGSGDDDDDDDEEEMAAAAGTTGAASEAGAPGRGGGGSDIGSANGARDALPPPTGLMGAEEILNDPGVISGGVLATRPAPQNILGGDAWDSDESD